MKNLIVFFSIALSLGACSQNDEEKVERKSLIINNWSLMNFEPGLSPTENFNEMEIIWEFQQNGILKISIDSSTDSSPIKSDGVYPFSLNGNRISIDNLEYDFLIRNNNSLIISDNPSSDGFRATFSIIIEE